MWLLVSVFIVMLGPVKTSIQAKQKLHFSLNVACCGFYYNQAHHPVWIHIPHDLNENPYFGLNLAAVAMEINTYNPYRSYIWKT